MSCARTTSSHSTTCKWRCHPVRRPGPGAFYVDVLGMMELMKPAAWPARGGRVVAGGDGAQRADPLGIEEDFRPAQKAHPAVLVTGLDELAARLRGRRHGRIGTTTGGMRRFFADDPFGNRLEFIGAVEDDIEGPEPRKARVRLPADTADKKVTFAELGPGLYAYTAEGDPNTGVIVGDDSVMVIDAQATPLMAGDVIANVRPVTDKPIKHVLLTHYHAVRVFGASAFRRSEVISSERRAS